MDLQTPRAANDSKSRSVPSRRERELDRSGVCKARMAMSCTSPASRVESCEPSICLMVIEGGACWVPFIQERLGLFAINSRPFSTLDFRYQREAQPTKLTIEMCARTKRVSMLGIRYQRETGSTTILIVEGSARWTPVTKERLGRLAWVYEGREDVGSTTSTSKAAAIEVSTSMLEIEGGQCRASGTKERLGPPLIFIVEDSTDNFCRAPTDLYRG